MPSNVRCPACGTLLTLPDNLQGNTATCGVCHRRLIIVRKKHAPAQPTVPSYVPPLPRQRPPFLTRTGAIVECPKCGNVERLEKEHLNRRIQCLECAQWYMVEVPGKGRIPFDCPHCVMDLVVSGKQAGNTIDCPDCDQPIVVPTKPLLVVPVHPPREEEPELEPQAGTANKANRRTCAICGTFLRNPTPFCSRCQRVLGMR